MSETTITAVDGTDALAFVIVRPGAAPGAVSIEAMAKGLSKPAAAHVLRQVADMWDAESAPVVADLTLYELRIGSDEGRPEVIAQYATTLACMEHGEAQYRAKHGTSDALEWPSLGTDDAPRWRLMAVEELDGEETLTDWHIVAVTIPAKYTPAGGESR